MPKLSDIEVVLARKKVDNCGIQKSKTNSVENRKIPYNRIFLGRKENKQLGIGFLVNKSLKVTSTNLVKETIATMTLTKKDKFKSKSTPTGVKIFRIEEKQCELSIVDLHATLMGITSSQEKNSSIDNFYNDVQKTIKGFHSRDLIIVGDLNAKLGKNIQKI